MMSLPLATTPSNPTMGLLRFYFKSGALLGVGGIKSEKSWDTVVEL